MVLLLWGLRILGTIEVADSLAILGARAMLGCDSLQQSPHTFEGGLAHHDVHLEANGEHSHAHTLQDLSVGVLYEHPVISPLHILLVSAGIILFLIVEKVVRYVEENSTKEVQRRVHGHHHHLKKKLKDESKNSGAAEEKSLIDESGVNRAEGDRFQHGTHLQKRVSATKCEVKDSNAENGAEIKKSFYTESSSSHSQSSLVFGYSNIFSDVVHNFTDGLALGSAFLLHGSVGGWFIALFLLAHELPQEVGDFRILVNGVHRHQSIVLQFSISVGGIWWNCNVSGKDPGQFSLTEGLTAGGLILLLLECFLT